MGNCYYGGSLAYERAQEDRLAYVKAGHKVGEILHKT
jgi:hypothetical protein